MVPTQPATRPSGPIASRPATQPPELDLLLARIDTRLFGQCCEDIRAWLDQRVRQQIGGILPDARHVKYRPEAAYVRMTGGAAADMAAQLLRAYELLGDAKYRDAALQTCQFLLKAQQPKGYWLTAYVATRSGGVGPQASRRICRIRNGCQFRPFALLLYAHRLTGEQSYFEAAKRCADCLRSIQCPATGSWPDYRDFSKPPARGAGIDAPGVYAGGSYHDFATTDAMRMMVMMYHATGEREYVAGLPRLGKWIFVTQLGQGGVRGWCPQYGPASRPIAAPHPRTPVIHPEVFSRFTGPMLGWLYGMTGREESLALLRETYAWMRSVERPEGWAEYYLPDGTEVFCRDRKLWRYDDAKAPTDAPAAYTRDKVRLDDVKKLLDVIAAGGREGLIRWHAGPTVLSPDQYHHARLAAARRATDPRRLRQVRKRWMRQDAPDLPNQDCLGRGGVERQAWHSIHTWTEPYHPPLGLSQWQYVYDVRLARGEISADAAATGGRGLEAMRLYERWDVLGDWTQRAIEVERWLDVPLDEPAAPP